MTGHKERGLVPGDINKSCWLRPQTPLGGPATPARSPLPNIPVLPLLPALPYFPSQSCHSCPLSPTSHPSSLHQRHLQCAVDTRPSSPSNVRCLLGALFPELLLNAFLTSQVDHFIIDAGQLVRVLGAVDDTRAVPSPQWQLLQGPV